MKVRTLIMTAAIFFAIVPMLVYIIMNVNFISKSGDESFRSQITAEAKSESSALNIIIENARSNIAVIENFAGVRLASQNGDENAQADDFLNSLMNENPMISAARLINQGGRIIAGTDKGQQFASFEGYKTSPENTLLFDAVSGDSQQNSTMFIKKNIGSCMLVVSYGLTGSNSVISRVTSNSKFINSDSRIIIVDKNGNYSLGNGFNKNVATVIGDSVYSQLTALGDGATSNIVQYTSDGKDWHAAMINVGGASGLYAIATCPETNVSNGSYTSLIVAGIILAIIAVIAAIVVSGAVTSPLKKIQETLAYIRNGDHEARIGNVANNEYGQLSRAFNNVVDEIVVSEDRYKNISEMSDNIIFEWNFKTNEVMFSNNFNKKFSFRAASDHFGDSFLLKAKIHPDDADRYRRDLDQLEKGVSFSGNEYRIKNIYGDFIWILMRTEALKDKEGKPVKVVGVMVDIDRAKKSEQQLTERASFDALTGLYNRETIENQINNEISLSEVRKSEMAVLFVDVDDFKHFNDNYSHATGDEVLKFVAGAIKSEVENIGFAGRYGGDEFIVLVRNAETNNPAGIAERIISKLSGGFDAQDVDAHLNISVSIGIALIKDDYNTRVEYLIGKADDAMYSVKKSGKSNYAFI